LAADCSASSAGGITASILCTAWRKSGAEARSTVTRESHFEFREEISSLLLVPFGPVEHEDLEFLKGALSARGMKVSIATERKVPAAAFDAARRQYRAHLFLKTARDEPGDRVLAVTNYDLYASNLNFVFGLADSPGKSAVISLYRLRRGVDEETFRHRAMKEAVHELGHTWGLSHCQNPRCVMHFSNSLEDTDRKETVWCESCDRKL
jgi:archaemetzincin